MRAAAMKSRPREVYCEPVKYLRGFSTSAQWITTHSCCSAAFAEMRLAGSYNSMRCERQPRSQVIARHVRG